MIRKQEANLVKESLLEMVHFIDNGLNYKKTNTNSQNESMLKTPTAIVLFSIIDCFGSIFSKNYHFTITINGKETVITSASNYINILNSKYFDFNLSKTDLLNIYNNYRCRLIHSTFLSPSYMIKKGDYNDRPIVFGLNKKNKINYTINLVPFFEVTKKAIETLFIDFNNDNIEFLPQMAIKGVASNNNTVEKV